jgi:nitrite reductase (cytochrome c-552)
VTRAAEWADTHPDIYASYLRNHDNDQHYQYTEAYPYITVLYEGMGFAFDYNSARGHVYSIIDLDATGRPHAFANCFACKTPDIHAIIAEEGLETYAIPYEELRDRIIEPVSCFTCHANEPGEIVITHQYLADALGNDFPNTITESLACAQCHVEYYFDPVSREVILPYNSLRSMNPDSILNYFNNLTMPDGQVYADYVNPRSGVRQIKIQHPEFETFYGSGSNHRYDFACADCHMGYVDNDDGERFVNHEWMSPLSHPNLIAENCSECHVDLEAEVRTLQAEVRTRTDAIGEALSALMEELVLVVESEEYTDEELYPVRMKFREAQFYWDFVFVENSNGAHNTNLTHQALEKAESLYADTQELLSALVG